MTKGEDTRATVLSTALSLATAEGLTGLTIGRLADEVGMSKSGLFAHFSSKENLQVEILKTATERFLAKVIAPALKAKRGEPRVAALFEGWLGWKDEFPGGCIFAVASVELDDKPGPARDVLVASQKDWLETFATAARIAVEEKHFKKTLDTGLFAHELYCLGYGHFSIARLLRDPQAETRTRAVFERILASARASDR